MRSIKQIFGSGTMYINWYKTGRQNNNGISFGEVGDNEIQ